MNSTKIHQQHPRMYTDSQARLFRENAGPFDSSSVSSFNFTDDETSDDEKESSGRQKTTILHSRGISQTSISKGSDGRPSLNIITAIAATESTRHGQSLKVSTIPVKNAHIRGRMRAFSITSQKASPATVSPEFYLNQAHKTKPGPSNIRRSPATTSPNRPKISGIFKQQRQFTRKPARITTKKEHNSQDLSDEKRLALTPLTPVIVITPADTDFPLPLPRRLNHGSQETVNRNVEKQESTTDVSKSSYTRYQSSRISSTSAIESPDQSRPASQGWWNLMLSPLLRSASVASRLTRNAKDTPPVPPMPFSPDTGSIAPWSAVSDPAFLVSPSEASPETPRRQGLAKIMPHWSGTAAASDVDDMSTIKCESHGTHSVGELEKDFDEEGINFTGLAAEYYHACAIEQATSRPYFECINHSCVDKLPKLVKDSRSMNVELLGSPFTTPALSKAHFGNDNRRLSNEESPLSPDIFSPNVYEASIVKLPTSNNERVKESKKLTKAIDSAQTKDKDNSFCKQSTMKPTTTIIDVTPIEKIITQSDEKCEEIKKSESPSHTSNDKTKGSPSLKVTDSYVETELDRMDKPPAYPAPIQHKYPSHESTLPRRLAFVNSETEYPELPERQPKAPVTAAALDVRDRRLSIERRRRRYEREDRAAKKAGGFWRGRGCISNRHCFGRAGPENRAKRRLDMVISALLLGLIILCIILAVTLTRHGDATQIESQWLNLTGYPAMPTGISTIATPNLAASQNQCVGATTLWSCSVPKEDREDLGSNSSDQPNFRFEIRFRNGTVPSNMTLPIDGTQPGNRKTSKDPFTNEIFVANPPAPSLADQSFLGNTTDNNTQPFEGEVTPFYMTFMPTFPIVPQGYQIKSTKLRRDDSNSTEDGTIPGPALADDGSAASANLLPTSPHPQSQPIRLFNRGLPDEHYGFYVYYDKSIYLSGIRIRGSTGFAGANTPEADQDGGSTKQQASVRCTFSQTRFLIKIWTQPGFANLLSSPAKNEPPTKNSTSSATNFERPGSFPYPTSITLDRHGGALDLKGIYCYGVQNGQIASANKTIVAEIRNFGGTLINPAPNLLEDANEFDRKAGGIDGGTGGCGCEWQNWE